MSLHTDGDESMLASLWVGSCSTQAFPSSAWLWVSHSGSDKLVQLFSHCPASCLPLGALPFLESTVKDPSGRCCCLCFLPPFCSQSNKHSGPLCLKLVCSDPELWPPVSISECVTQPTALSLVNNSLSAPSICGWHLYLQKLPISTCQRSLGC